MAIPLECSFLECNLQNSISLGSAHNWSMNKFRQKMRESFRNCNRNKLSTTDILDLEVVECSVHSRLCGSISGIYSLDASSTFLSMRTTNNVSRHWQMSPWDKMFLVESHCFIAIWQTNFMSDVSNNINIKLGFALCISFYFIFLVICYYHILLLI